MRLVSLLLVVLIVLLAAACGNEPALPSMEDSPATVEETGTPLLTPTRTATQTPMRDATAVLPTYALAATPTVSRRVSPDQTPSPVPTAGLPGTPISTPALAATSVPTAGPTRTAVPTAMPTSEEYAVAYLSHVIPWFESKSSNSEDGEAALLVSLWVHDRGLGVTMANLPWIADGIGDDERLVLSTLARGSFMERGLAETMVSRPWFTDSITVDEYGAVRELGKLTAVNPDLAIAVANGPWVRDEVPYTVPSAIKALRRVSAEDPDLARQIHDFQWVSDGISILEINALHALGEIAKVSIEFARPWAAKLGDTREDLRLHVLQSIFSFVTDGKEEFRQLESQPWFADGLDEEETAFVATLGYYSHRWPELFQDLMEARFTKSGSVSLPLAGQVNIWVFQPVPFEPHDEVVATIAETLKIAEAFMGIPFPTSEVILLSNFDASSGHFGAFMALSRRGTSHLGYVPHETAHYYFGNTMRGPSWFLEGGAEFIQALVLDHLGIQSLSDRKIEVTERFNYCLEHFGIENISELDELEVRDGTCEYSMGETLYLNLYEIMGREAMGAALRELPFSLLVSEHELLPSDPEELPVYSDDGRNEKIYRAFLKHAPADRREEFRELYLSLHGGSY